jgi:hypothetical protein
MFLSQYFSFPLSVSFHQCSTLILMCILALPEGQTGEAWELPNKAILFRKSGSVGYKSTFTFFFRPRGPCALPPDTAVGSYLSSRSHFKTSPRQPDCARQHTAQVLLPGADWSSERNTAVCPYHQRQVTVKMYV